MLRRITSISMVLIGLLMVFGVVATSGQEGEVPLQPIITSATNSVGLGSYVAAEAYGLPAGAEDPAAQPAQAMILPYGIYPNMEVETVEDFVQPASLFEEGWAFEWSLASVPEGSAAVLLTAPTDSVAIFQTDVQGRYELALSVTDPAGNAAESVWAVDASTYIGVGGMSGMEIEEDTNCASCHEEEAENWSATGHATALVRGLDGLKGDHFGPNCVSCHSTGFNNHSEAANGGFDDVATEAGWTFPATLQAGNWDTMVAEMPNVAALANVQCEACHGPGYLHVYESSRRDPMIGTALSYGTCAQCHAEEPYHTIPLQWENSSHAIKNARAFTYPIGEEEQACVRCHSGVGFIDYVNGVEEEERRVDYQPITCAVCHDPHSAKNPNQLRVFDVITLPNGTEVADAGPAATCMTCHNVRRDGGAEGQVAAGVAGERFSPPHEGNNMAELLSGTGGFTFGAILPSSGHVNAVEDTCTDCHMSPTPGMDNMGTPDDRTDDQPLPGHNTLGGHTFAMVDAEGVENIGVCQKCHDGEADFAFDARRDYDGDGTIETNQEELVGLRELVWTALLEKGLTETEERPFFAVPEGSGEEIYGAIWNYYFTERESTAIHNLKYAISLLQLSYEKLTGSPVPNATIIPPKAVAE